MANPLKDKLAIVGLGTTPYGRSLADTDRALALQACREAVLDAGLSPKDIDGICGGGRQISLDFMRTGLGTGELTWWSAGPVWVFSFNIMECMAALAAGFCNYALTFRATSRGPGNSHSAARDIFRARAATLGNQGAGAEGQLGRPYAGVPSFDGWMARYLYEYKATREDFGLIAINARSNAALNPHATNRTPITMEDYLSARMIREPMCLLDMDLPIDGADAVIITTAERAKDLKKKPVYIHAMTAGLPENEESSTDLQHFAQHVVAKVLWGRSDLKLEDMDIAFPYDGFTIINMMWIEAMGWCGPGEGGAFMRQNWDKKENRIKVNGRMPFNTHGGSLNDGATQGCGHTREAILQLRGEAGARQVPDCEATLLMPGGFFSVNLPSGFILRT